MEQIQIDSEFSNLQIKRKLASLQIIADVSPCLNDSNLEICKVLGWQVVCQKDAFKKGDLVVYFEIDSKLMEDRWNTDMEFYDYRVTTVTIAGELSQGLIKQASELIKDLDKYKIGDDLTELLSVEKYDEEEKSSSILDGGLFPVHLVPYTDEPRVQSEPKYLEAFKGKAFIGSIKYDGTSATYLLNPENNNELWACSRNKRLDPKKKDDYWKIAEKYKIKEKLQKYPDFAIQGEVYGPGIQKNLLGMKDKTIAIFNVFSISNKRCLDYDELVEACEKMELPPVKLLVRGDCFSYTIDDLFELVKGNYEGTENQREGIVFRLAKNWFTPNFRASFKIISNDFLVKK